LSSKKEYYEGGTIPWLVSGEVAQGEITSSSNFITGLGLQNSSAKIFPENTVLVAMYGATAGEVGILRFKAATNQAICGVLPNDKFFPKFMFYLLLSRKQELISQATGNAQPNISQIKIKNTVIPVPPMAEQQHIVAILDEAFVGLATATGNVEKNLKNARELYESYLQAAFTTDDVEWSPHTLDQICSFTSGGTPSKANKSYWNGDIPWVSGRDMKSDRICDAALHISQKAVEGSGTRIAPVGSLLVLVRGMGLANGIALGEVISPCAFNQDIKAIRPNLGVDPRFLLLSLRAVFARSENLLSNAAHGTLKVEMDKLRSIPLQIPPLQVQQGIVSKIDSLALEAQRLERLCQQKLSALQSLKQSLLQKAFSGELTKLTEAAAGSSTANIVTHMRRDTALVIALAYERHKRKNRDKSFGHTKEQKIIHIVEAVTGLDLGRQPIRDAAGPNDFHHMLAAEEWAETNRYFKFSERGGAGYQFQPLAQFRELLDLAKTIDPLIRKETERVIDLFVPMDAQEAEVFATVYAAWNNCLIEGTAPTDDEIIGAAREDWHPSKLKISRAKFVEGLRQIRASKLIPDGRGRFVPPPAQSQLPL
jgi:type I restriction enzyme S subunit